ncbi:hypothetical protein K9M41_04285 [Candidatus Gracilibacteria bacterium]|nr:hypothetical protein [Candidatus Gracilibacteria bacterium]
MFLIRIYILLIVSFLVLSWAAPYEDIKEFFIVLGSIIQIPIFIYAIYSFSNNTRRFIKESEGNREQVKELIKNIKAGKDEDLDMHKVIVQNPLWSNCVPESIANKQSLDYKQEQYLRSNYGMSIDGYRDVSVIYKLKYLAEIVPEVSNDCNDDKDPLWVELKEKKTTKDKGIINIENVNSMKLRFRIINSEKGNEITLRTKKKSL